MARTGTFTKIKEYVSPDIRDVIFYEEVDEQNFNPDCYTLCETTHSCELDFKLVFIGPLNRQTSKRRLYYAADREDQWKYNYQYVGLNAIGGNRYKSYTRTYVVPRGEWEPDLLSPGDPDPDKTGDEGTEDTLDDTTVFDQGEFVFTGERMVRMSDERLDACYVMYIRTFSKLCLLTGVRWDSELEEMVEYSIEIKPASDITNPTSLEADGTYTEVKPLNCDWSQCTTDKALNPSKSRTYWTYSNMRLPAVLDYLDEMVWRRHDGGEHRVYRPVYLRKAQQKPVLTRIVRTYSTTVVDLNGINPKPVSMQPNSIYYNGPQVKVSIPACLHDDQTFINDIGTTNPTWVSTTGSSRTDAATTLSDGTPCLDWPSELLIEVQQNPYKGGYVLDYIYIYPLA